MNPCHSSTYILDTFCGLSGLEFVIINVFLVSVILHACYMRVTSFTP